MKDIRLRLARLERLPLLASPTFAVDMELYVAHPEGSALIIEYFQAIARETAKLPPAFHHSLLRQRLLQDARVREISSRFAEIIGGLDFEPERKK